MTNILKSRNAIDFALFGDWENAKKTNLEILDEYPNDIDTLNRLGFAYLKLKEFTKAKNILQQVIKLDPYNQIANKHLQSISLQKAQTNNILSTGIVNPLMFLEDPGKTKLVNCVNIASANELVNITVGQEVFLKSKKHNIEIRDENDVYLGALPDDISFKLIKYIEGGNTYLTAVKSVGKNSLVVLIRETARGKKFINQPSFLHSLQMATATFEPVVAQDKSKKSEIDEKDDLLSDDTEVVTDTDSEE